MNTFRKQSHSNNPTKLVWREGPFTFHLSDEEFSMSGNSSSLTLNPAICSFNPSPLKMSSRISLSRDSLCLPEETKIEASHDTPS